MAANNYTNRISEIIEQLLIERLTDGLLPVNTAESNQVKIDATDCIINQKIESAIQLQLAAIHLPIPESLIHIVFDYLFPSVDKCMTTIIINIMEHQLRLEQIVSIINDSSYQIYAFTFICGPNEIIITRWYNEPNRQPFEIKMQ